MTSHTILLSENVNLIVNFVKVYVKDVIAQSGTSFLHGTNTM